MLNASTRVGEIHLVTILVQGRIREDSFGGRCSHRYDVPADFSAVSSELFKSAASESAHVEAAADGNGIVSCSIIMPFDVF